MVSDNIKEICSRKGLTILELGTMIGKNKSAIYSILKNGNPTVDTLEMIAKALNVDITELFDKNIEAFTCPHCGQPIRNKDFLPKVKAED